MKSIATLFLFVILSISSVLGQLTVGNLKDKSDKSLKSIFHSKVFNKIKFIDPGLSNTQYENRNYEEIVDVNIFGYRQYFYSYQLYSKKINYTFSFVVVLDSIGNVLNKDEIIRKIPECVRFGNKCKFISKEKATIIAVRDSIQFPDNLKTELVNPQNSKRFYWVVSGQNKNLIDYSKEAEKIIYPMFKENTRYIDVLTGEIKEFNHFTGDVLE